MLMERIGSDVTVGRAYFWGEPEMIAYVLKKSFALPY